MITILATTVSTARAESETYRYKEFYPPESSRADGNADGELTVAFMGTASLLISDGESSVMTDGFFTRPNLLKVMRGKVEPDEGLIDAALARINPKNLAAVIVVHSHYDHSMDAPVVAMKTGATLVGSESTANVGRGLKLPEDQIRVATSGEPMKFGNFTVTLIDSKHAPTSSQPNLAGEITEPLVPPVEANAYKEGQAYSVLIQHEKGSALIQGSAGYIEGALAPYQADVVFLGAGGLGGFGTEYSEKYLSEIVGAVSALKIVPIHYDNFFVPFENAAPTAGFIKTMDFLISKTECNCAAELQILPAWDAYRLWN